ncbi:hypothetical protein QR680_014373 [Steinernema hermaphroditum]|uniref:Large ribosomal subunit protein mL50 n=1 Tax=Steinernema hermaphroditum TaxID=289476 RepID=A0AA39IBB5_9BILA|nr:hypothetical protein QR680_014373 [Steinernema hermaphroditum]
MARKERIEGTSGIVGSRRDSPHAANARAMRTSLVLSARRGLFSSFMKSAASSQTSETAGAEVSGLSREQQDKLKGKLALLRKEEEKKSDVKLRDVHDDGFGQNYMDSIRARSLLKFTYNYKPPADVDLRVRLTTQAYCKCKSLEDARHKADVLKKLGDEFGHYVPNCQLHKIKTVEDLVDFYSQEVKNITKYSELARDDSLPENLSIRENPLRFHPNDTQAPHRGVTAFPGTGGEVFGLRNKRIYREFNPKKEWFDYEEMSFDYTKVDKDMPWDPEVAKRMDAFTDKKYKLKSNSFQKAPVREV